MNSLGFYLGYYSFMIILLVIAVIVAKKRNPWGWFVAAAVIQFFAFVGEISEFSAGGTGNNLVVDIIIYIVLLSVSAVLICLRSKKRKASDSDEEVLSDNYKQ